MQKASTWVSGAQVAVLPGRRGRGEAEFTGRTLAPFEPSVGSVTVLFLARHSRVSVSCGSDQLPGPDGWTAAAAATSPARPRRRRRGVSLLLCPLMPPSLAERRGGGWGGGGLCFQAV